MGVRDESLEDQKRRHLAFIPGLLETADIWQDTMQRLEAKGTTTVAFDLPGHRQGEGEERVSHRLQSEQWLEEIASHLRTQTRAGKVVLIGHSTGGMVALLLAHRFPTLVHSVIAVGALTCGRRDRAIDPLARLLSNDMLGPSAFRAALQLWLSTPERFQLGFRWSSAVPPKVSIADTVRQQLLQCDPMVLRACAKWVIESDIRSLLPQIKVPVMAVIGTEDRIVGPGHQIALIKRVPNAHAQLIHAGHLVFSEAPERLHAALSSWIENASHIPVQE
ncbi:MAG: alpha/beta fold hydrolase [Paracoccaceae bacterium]